MFVGIGVMVEHQVLLFKLTHIIHVLKFIIDMKNNSNNKEFLPTRRVDLNLYNVFVAVMLEQNISKAGELIGLTQSAVSQALGRLRTIYNDPLFVRHSKEMLPTALAKKIYPDILQAMQNIQNSLPQPKLNMSSLDMTFHINTSNFYFIRHIQKFVATVNELAPNVAIDISSVALESPQIALKNRTTDIYLDIFPIEHESCYHEQLLIVNPAVLARKEHPRLQGNTTITQEEYFKEKHAVLMPKGSDNYPLKLAKLHNLKDRKIRFISANMEQILSICEVTDYLCMVPKITIDNYVHKDRFSYFEPPFSFDESAVYMNWHASVEHNPAHRWLRQQLKIASKIE